MVFFAMMLQTRAGQESKTTDDWNESKDKESDNNYYLVYNLT